MKTLTALALILAGSSVAYAGSNESFIGQVGAYNGAIVSQLNGNNKSAVLQAGVGNHAFVNQASASGPTTYLPIFHIPIPGLPGGPNNSFVGSSGWFNTALVGQSTFAGGNNGQLTLQNGVGNTAITTQNSSEPTGFNGSATIQEGWGNTAITSQASYGSPQNLSATVQAGVHNFALTVQK